MREFILTNEGAVIFARATDEKPIVFTRMQFGAGAPPEDIREATSLTDARQTFSNVIVSRGLFSWTPLTDAHVTVSEDEPTTPAEGDYWLDPSGSFEVLKQYVSGGWETRDYDPTATEAGCYKYDGGTLYVSAIDEQTICVKATGTNDGLADGFRITEIGFFAKVEDDEDDVLFAYRAIDADAANTFSPNPTRSPMSRDTYDQTVYVTVGEDTSIIQIQSGEYASHAELQTLRADFEDFKLTASADIDAHGSSISTIQNTLYESVGPHIENTNNPHGTTAAQVGAAPSVHGHNASDIAAGILGVPRGGTGVASYQALADALRPFFSIGGGNTFCTEYIGDGAHTKLNQPKVTKKIALPFKPLYIHIWFEAPNGWEYDPYDQPHYYPVADYAQIELTRNGDRSFRNWGRSRVGVYSSSSGWGNTNRKFGLESSTSGGVTTYFLTVDNNNIQPESDFDSQAKKNWAIYTNSNNQLNAKDARYYLYAIG